MNDSLSVANYILSNAKNVNLIKLTSLMYYAQGWHFGFFGKPLFNEPIRAVFHGIRICKIWNEFIIFGGEVIDTVKKRQLRTKEDVEFLDQILSVYDKYTDVQLCNASHAKDSPWYHTWYELNKYKYEILDIPDRLMIQAFNEKKNENLKILKND